MRLFLFWIVLCVLILCTKDDDDDDDDDDESLIKLQLGYEKNAVKPDLCVLQFLEARGLDLERSQQNS